MTIDPLVPFWFLVTLTALLVAFSVWRLVVSPGLRARLSWLMRVAAVLLLAAVAAQPIIPAEPAERAVTEGGLEVYIVVDTTSSMAAEDWAGGAPRLDGVKVDIRSIAQRLDGASFSLVTFDGAVTQRVPLTTDATALVSAGDVLTQEVTAYSRGSSVDEAVPLKERMCTSRGCLSLKLSRQRSPLGFTNIAGISENSATKKPISKTDRPWPTPLISASPHE